MYTSWPVILMLLCFAFLCMKIGTTFAVFQFSGILLSFSWLLKDNHRYLRSF